MVAIFSSPSYYLTAFVSIMFCYIIDLFIAAWQFEINTNPTDLLRKIISYDMKLEDKEKQLQSIFAKLKT